MLKWKILENSKERIIWLNERCLMVLILMEAVSKRKRVKKWREERRSIMTKNCKTFHLTSLKSCWMMKIISPSAIISTRDNSSRKFHHVNSLFLLCSMWVGVERTRRNKRLWWSISGKIFINFIFFHLIAHHFILLCVHTQQ